MAGNPIPENYNDLITLAQKMAYGASAYGAAIGLVHFTSATITTALNNLINSQQDYKSYTPILRLAYDDRDAHSETGAIWIGRARDVLKAYLGNDWNPGWMAAGFVHHSLAVPDKVSDRLNLLNALRAYFIAHPAQENHPLEVTAETLNTQFTELQAAVNAVSSAETQNETRKDVRDLALKNLKKQMRGMIKELETLLSPTDPRWLSFGLNEPANTGGPGIPQNLQASPIAGGFIAEWESAPRCGT